VAVRVVVAFQDAEQLHRLVQSINSMMQHHLVILHIERRSPHKYQTAVNSIAERYTNVVVLQFGTIIYETDSVSHISWNSNSFITEYDYVITLDGAV
jgi:hypothetical protein